MRWRQRISGRADFNRWLLSTTSCVGELLEARRLMTTFYVDTNNAAASDKNAGTSLTAPLKTIGAAVQLAENNNAASQSDTILIRGGIYREQPFLWTSLSGASAANRTVISAYVNPTTGTYEPVYIDAADPTTGTWIEDGTSNRWYLPNFTTQTSGVFVDWSPSNDGASLQQIGGYGTGFFDQRVEVGSGVGDMIPGSYYGDVADSRLYVWLADGSNPNSHTIEYSNRARSIYEPGTALSGGGYSYVNHIDFDGLNLRHNNVYATGGQDTGCAMYTEGDQRLIDMDIEWNAGVGVYLRGTSQMIDCDSSNNGSNGIQAQGSGFTVNGGQYNYNYWRNYTDAGEAGIKIITNNPLSYGNIMNAEFGHNYGKGLWFDTDFENTVVSQITGNYIHDNQGDGIDLEASRNFLVANNVIVGNHSDGLSLNAVENAWIYNNTFVGNYGIAAIDLDGGTRSQGSTYPGTTGLLNDTVRDNIIANNFTAYDLDIPTLAEPSTYINNDTSDYNLIYRRGGPVKFTTGGTYLGWGTTPNSLAGWQTASGQDAHSIAVDPLFLAGGTGEFAYQLGSNSPVRGLGANLVSSITTDIVGALRPTSGGFDLGAFQYASGGLGTAGPVITNTDSSVWVDDQLPDTAAMTTPDQTGNIGQNQFWLWNSTNVYSGAASLDSTVMAGLHRQYFIGAAPRSVASTDTLFAYVWIDPANLPSQIMLEWRDSSGSWNHMAYWGQKLITGGVDGSTGFVSMGALPTAGQWVQLAVPAASVGLAGKKITGFSFDLYNGRALLDKIGNGVPVVSNATLSGTVYQDNNGNGVMDPGEPALSGRTVYLDLNNNGALDAGEPSTVTNSNGAYSFTNLSQGTYVVRQVVPSGDIASTVSGASYSESLSAGAATIQNFGQFPTQFNARQNPDNFMLRRSPDGAQLQIWENGLDTQTPAYSIAEAQVSQLLFEGGGFSGGVTVNFAYGSPLPSGGLTVDSPGNWFLSVYGPQNLPNTFQVSAGAVNLNGTNINFTKLWVVDLHGGSANDTITQLSGQTPVLFSGGGGNDTLNVNSGNFAFTGDPQSTTTALTVNVAQAATVTFAAGAPGSGLNVFHLAGLNLNSGAVATVQQADTSSDRSVLILNSLTFPANTPIPMGKLDLSNNDMIVYGGDIQAISSELVLGYSGGTWAGPEGIVSSAAAADASHITALGFMPGLAGIPFDNQTVSSSDVLVKYTYYGDTNLDGVVDGSDYSRLDSSYMRPVTGWFNGDFNYDGSIDGSDYSLIDTAFNSQGASLSATIAILQQASYQVVDSTLAGATTAQVIAGSTTTTTSTTQTPTKKPRMYIRGSESHTHHHHHNWQNLDNGFTPSPRAQPAA